MSVKQKKNNLVIRDIIGDEIKFHYTGDNLLVIISNIGKIQRGAFVIDEKETEGLIKFLVNKDTQGKPNEM